MLLFRLIIRQGYIGCVARAMQLAMALFVVLARSSEAAAYRPFDGTDADVARLGEFELEAGPFGYLDSGDGSGFIVPAVVLNYGILPRLELVAQSYLFLPQPVEPGAPRVQPGDTGLFLKAVLREGALQDKPGPSLAIEVGPLLPTLVPEMQVGGSAAAIVSMRWQPITLHFNYEVRLGNTAGQTPGARLYLLQEATVIGEGPAIGPVRPVAEALIDFTAAHVEALSLLVGGLWTVDADTTLDLAGRLGRADGINYEVRAGITWAVQLGPSNELATP